MDDVERRTRLEQLAGEMRRRAGAGRGIAVLPGLALSSAISSLMVRAGSDGCATITVGVAHISVTGAKSLTGSYGVFG